MRNLSKIALAVGLLATAACERDTTTRADQKADELYQRGKETAVDVGRDIKAQGRETTRDIEGEARQLREDLRSRSDAETTAQLPPDQDPWENTRENPDPRAPKPPDITAAS